MYNGSQSVAPTARRTRHVRAKSERGRAPGQAIVQYSTCCCFPCTLACWCFFLACAHQEWTRMLQRDANEFTWRHLHRHRHLADLIASLRADSWMSPMTAMEMMVQTMRTEENPSMPTRLTAARPRCPPIGAPGQPSIALSGRSQNTGSVFFPSGQRHEQHGRRRCLQRRRGRL